jgi:hypothetical protein
LLKNSLSVAHKFRVIDLIFVFSHRSTGLRAQNRAWEAAAAINYLVAIMGETAAFAFRVIF